VRLATLIALAAAPLVLTACSTGSDAPVRARAAIPAADAIALPLRGQLSASAAKLKGPRVMTEVTHGRELVMFGNTSRRPRILVAGCVNGRRCAGTGVVDAAMIGCPPPDAELWYLPTLTPDGADLDVAPTHPGAAAWRQAVADLRPSAAIAFRTGPKALVRASAAAVPTARRYARLAGLPFRRDLSSGGLAGWAATARPGTVAFTVELPGERVSARKASRLAYAIDRLSGTRFAAGAQEERRNLIAHGRDPRAFWH
jgi:hypothetical protein